MKALKAILAVFLLLLGPILCSPATAGTAQELYRQGRAALRAGETQRAVELFSEAISIAPSNFRYYNDRGVAYKRMKKLHKALADYSKALEIRPGWPPALNNRGVCYLEQKRYEDAVRDFTEALTRGTLQSKLYTNRGIALAGLGRHKEAIADFRKAISSTPTDYRAFLEMGLSLEKLGEKEKALRIYQLAEGLVKSPAALRFLSRRVAALAKKPKRGPEVLPAGERPGRGSRAPGKSPRKSGAQRSAAKAPWSRGPGVLKGVKDYAALHEGCRRRDAKGFAGPAGRLFRAGMEFEGKSDLPRALVMFEDALQLARRNRNAVCAAWAMLEIGRLRTLAGEPQRALRYLRGALSLFRKLRRHDEALVAMVELGRAAAAAGLPTKAGKLLSQASAFAEASGRVDLAKSIRMQSPAPRPRPAAAPAGKRFVGTKTIGSLSSRVSPGMRVGRGPVEWKGAEHKPRIGQVLRYLVSKRPTKRRHGTARHKIEQPEREVFWAKGYAPHKNRRRPNHLAELKRLKAKGDEAGMIVVLEKLAGEYERKRKYSPARLCLSASIALREKLGKKTGLANVLLKRGVLSWETGRRAAGLEDLVRGAVLAGGEGRQEAQRGAVRKARKLASEMGLDVSAVVSSLIKLEKARKVGDGAGVTRALFDLGLLYEKAGRPKDALNFFQRAAACIAIQSARLMRDLGRRKQADRTRNAALKTLKRLDYSAYLQIMNGSDGSRWLSRN